jgi:hypothetical protein
MRAAGRAWIALLLLLTFLALLPGLVYLLGLVATEGRPQPVDSARSGGACGAASYAHHVPMDPWRFMARHVGVNAKVNVPDVELEASWIARVHLGHHPRHSMLRWHLSSAALTIWITRHWSSRQIAGTARAQGYCPPRPSHGRGSD